jgi:hypothetical protein
MIMAQFLFSAKNREGKDVTERVTAANASAARYALETRGYREIVFHTDEMTQAIHKSLGFEDKEEDDAWTAEMELKARRGRANWVRAFSSLKPLAIIWVPLLAWTVFAAIHFRTYHSLAGRICYLALPIFLDLWFIKFYVLLVLPGIAYNSLLHAAVWHRWNKMRSWVKIIRWLNRIGKSSVPEYELQLRLAGALAAEGKLPEALQLVAPFEQDPKISKGSYFGRLASIYGNAKDFQEMVRCQKKAVEQGTGSAGELIDYACGLVQRQKNVAVARTVLAEAKEKEITSLAARYVHFCEGMMAVEEQNYPAAKKSLMEALRMAADSMNQPLTQGWSNTVRAYLCIAIGNLGDKAKARSLVQEVEPLLKIRREDELLQRCQQAAS